MFKKKLSLSFFSKESFLSKFISWQNICSKFPGLFGFIGIDVINDKRNWKIIEINPRFTSTFCGISRSYGQQADKLIRDFYIYKEKIFFRKLKFIRKTKVLF